MNKGKRLANEKNTKKPIYAYVKGKTKSRQTVGPLKRGDGKRTENDKETTEEWNKFFVSVYSKNTTTTRKKRTGRTANGKRKSDREEDKEKIEKMIAEAAPGPDGIRSAFLHQTKNEITRPLKIIF